MSKRILIIDGLNLFIRNFVADPSISTGGLPIGGCKGFLKSLQKICRETNPDQIIVVWDGPGGSKKKKKLFSEYKEGRSPLRLNRNFDNFSDEEELQNKNQQFITLIEYLNMMPIVQLILNDVEADDIISFVCFHNKDDIKIILSNDKDFIQLCNKTTILLRPVQDKILNTKRILEEYNIHPNNFALSRSLVGDKSDNIEGIRGIGLKTVAKRLPFLKEEKYYNFKDLYSYCSEHLNDNVKIFKDVLENKDKIEKNYKLIQLYSPNISALNSRKIKETLANFSPTFNQTGTITKMMKDGFTDYKWDSLFQKFKLIVSEKSDESGN